MSGVRLAEILKRRKITKYQFAKLIGEPYRHVFRFFHEDYDPKLSMLRRWAAALGVRVRDLTRE